MSERRLLVHLCLAVVVKLLLLAALWWAFVHDASVHTDSDAAAAHLTSPLLEASGGTTTHAGASR